MKKKRKKKKTEHGANWVHKLETPSAVAHAAQTQGRYRVAYILQQKGASSSSSLTMETPGLPQSDHSIWNAGRTSSSHRGNSQRSLSLMISYMKEKLHTCNYQLFQHYQEKTSEHSNCIQTHKCGGNDFMCTESN